MKIHMLMKVAMLGSALVLASGIAQAANKHEGAKKERDWVVANKVDGATTSKLNQLCLHSGLVSASTCLAKGADINAALGGALKSPLEADPTYGMYWTPNKKSNDFKFVFRKESAVAAVVAK